MKKTVVFILILFVMSLSVFSKDFSQQRIFSAFLHNSYYLLSEDEKEAWRECCKQSNLPSKIQIDEGFIKNEISLVEYALPAQSMLYAALLTGYCMGKDKNFIVDEWQ